MKKKHEDFKFLLKQITHSIKKTADSFRQLPFENANLDLIELIDGLLQLIISPSSVFQQKIDSLTECLKKIDQAQRLRDSSAISDLLEFEALPIFIQIWDETMKFEEEVEAL